MKRGIGVKGFVLLYAISVGMGVATSVRAATLAATYRFSGTFAADEVGTPPLQCVDPLQRGSFSVEIVFGQSRQVWAFDGDSYPPENQAGLILNTANLVADANYSVEMVFLFSERENAWRRILDVENRQSDRGFYVDPANYLNIFSGSGSLNPWSNNVYHHVVLTYDGTEAVTYLDSNSQSRTLTTVLGLNNSNNPERLMDFFLDNVRSLYTSEYSDGRVALIRLWDGILTSTQVEHLANDPFTSTLVDADFDEDGDVDGDDLARWQAGYSLVATATHGDGDADCDGDADGRDFLTWQRQYTGSLALASNVSVPEPAELSLAMLGITDLAWRFYRKL